MLLYIFCVAVLNLTLGFAVAVQLARRHRALIAATTQAPRCNRPASQQQPSSASAVAAGQTAIAPQPASDAAEPESIDPGAIEPEPLSDGAEPAEPEVGVEPGPSPDDSVEAIPTPPDDLEEGPSPDGSPVPEVITSADLEALVNPKGAVQGGDTPPRELGTYDARREPSETLPAASPRPSDLPQSVAAEDGDAPEYRPEEGPRETPGAAMEKALAQWQAEAARYFEQLARVSHDLRACQAAPEPTKIQGCLSTLCTAGEEYLNAATPARQSFERLSAAQPAADAARDLLYSAAGRQENVLRGTHRAAAGFDYQGDLQAGCRNMVEHTDNLLDASREIRDALQASTLAAARLGQPPAVDPDLRSAAVEEAKDEQDASDLAQWWEENRHRTRHLSVVMIEVDDFARIQEQHGPRAAGAVLRAVARLLEADHRGEGLTHRLADPRFACFYYDTDLEGAVQTAERLRQTLGQACFELRKEEIRLAVSCGVTEANTEDTPETLLGRAEAALLQSKRYGHNQTFSHDGAFPVPVTPPKLHVDAKRVEV